MLKKFKSIYQIIKESIDQQDIVNKSRYLPRYQYTNTEKNYTYIFSVKLTGHSIDQFDVRRFKKVTPFTSCSLDEGINLYYEKIKICLQQLADRDLLSDIKYRKEQSFLIYCKDSRLGFIAVIRNDGPRDVKSNYYSCTVTTTLPFYNSKPVATEPDDITVEVICESLKHLFNCYFVEIND